MPYLAPLDRPVYLYALDDESDFDEDWDDDDEDWDEDE